MGIDGVPDEMIAVQVTEFKKPYVIHKVPSPSSLRDHEILLKTAVASLCHTDSMVQQGVFGPKTHLPITASHEGTGTVVALGSSVNKFKKGDRVMAVCPKNQCGSCINCKGPNDWYQYCEKLEGHIGVFIDGAFSEYFVCDSRFACHVPDDVSFTSAAPLACAGNTIYRAIKVAGVSKGGWVAIVGAGGGLGHLGIQFALAQGLNLVTVEARDEGLELCKKAGATHIFDARKGNEEVAKQVQDLTDGLGVEAAINVSEHPTSAALSCAITRMHGTVVQVAQPDQVCIPFAELIFRDITVKGTLIAGPDVSQAMIDDVSKHKIQVETNLFYGLEEVPKMVELSHSGKMKGKAVCVVDRNAIEEEKGKVAA